MVIILGLGFTGQRLARRLLRAGAQDRVRVAALVRDCSRFGALAAEGLELLEIGALPTAQVLPKAAALFYSIPPLGPPADIVMHSWLCALEPRRIVYISSTGVYGEAAEVDEHTLPAPKDARGIARLTAEQRILEGPWSTLILRAAAIYGPHRGVHTAIREGRLPRSAGSGVISRIHAEDLAALSAAGLFSDVEGAWPVADDAPCTSAEIAAWYQARFGGPAPDGITEFSVAGRRVNGRKIRALLGVELEYPTWQAGLVASLREEEAREAIA